MWRESAAGRKAGRHKDKQKLKIVKIKRKEKYRVKRHCALLLGHLEVCVWGSRSHPDPSWAVRLSFASPLLSSWNLLIQLIVSFHKTQLLLAEILIGNT